METPTIIPAVGMGATKCLFSDRHAGTIVSVKGNTLEWCRDIATRTDNNGMSDSQSYAYDPDPLAFPQVFTKRRNGSWVREGESMRNGTPLAIGVRREYHDYSF